MTTQQYLERDAMSEKRPAIGYCRVSTLLQATAGVSLDAQEARIRAWAIAQDYDIVELCHDDGISGCSLAKREGAQRAIALACQYHAPLVVYSLSRLARSTRDAIDISERLHKAGADLVSLSEAIDTTTAAGKMVFRMLAVLAEFERDLVSERTKAALAHMKTNGKRVGQIPFGKRLSEDGETLIDVPEQQATIAQIHQMRDDGLSIQQIADELNRQDVPTSNGGRWRKGTVHRILKNGNGKEHTNGQ